jgi:hypothetical protein
VSSYIGNLEWTWENAQQASALTVPTQSPAQAGQGRRQLSLARAPETSTRDEWRSASTICSATRHAEELQASILDQVQRMRLFFRVARARRTDGHYFHVAVRATGDIKHRG